MITKKRSDEIDAEVVRWEMANGRYRSFNLAYQNASINGNPPREVLAHELGLTYAELVDWWDNSYRVQ
ncbi:MAG: hypothetical protein A2812_01090 [Candidatus Staskawiczbacteria bacterium RIFCSPHIGHO2_01_FULL_36_16]|uniref:Uncharacterized protein n=1 Tax=Candidatus Staskawiczbacteria bacterium RIFCSPHIGHO2_01_FULL_36_16 TaxID=1802200 RepID=A0A1G2HSB6_9BACT|nr:MAG: hypothetical protein A2812_01090 [Candidatus Staskawiczbacteria bacterium RIFCSPHIGHO2_01_FULL_36_16]